MYNRCLWHFVQLFLYRLQSNFPNCNLHYKIRQSSFTFSVTTHFSLKPVILWNSFLLQLLASSALLIFQIIVRVFLHSIFFHWGEVPAEDLSCWRINKQHMGSKSADIHIAEAWKTSSTYNICSQTQQIYISPKREEHHWNKWPPAGIEHNWGAKDNRPNHHIVLTCLPALYISVEGHIICPWILRDFWL